MQRISHWIGGGGDGDNGGQFEKKEGEWHEIQMPELFTREFP